MTKNPRLERSFSPKSKFSIDFWAPSGSIWASRDVPGASQKPLILNKFSVASANQPGPASGRLQRVPGCHPDTSLAQFCVDFGSILRVDFDIHSFGNALIFRVKCSRFCCFFLHLSFMHVTLMRTKGTLDRWIDTQIDRYIREELIECITNQICWTLLLCHMLTQQPTSPAATHRPGSAA